MRIMLDTNILISAFVFKSKKMKELIERKFKVDEKSLEKFLETFPFELVYSPARLEEKKFEIRDEKDYIILYTAIIENVDILITGDKDFKDVEIERPEILTCAEFLEKYVNIKS